MGYFIVFFKYGVVGNSIRIEASSICQLKCPECPQTKGKLEIIGKGYLKFEDFKKIVDNYPNFRNIELSNYGEMFLNLELKNIIKYAYEKNINLTAGNGVNLNAASEEMIRCLVKYRFKAITISIDGACNYTYKIYRRGGNSDRVIDNIKKINYYK
jgi:molybdenum cofactor biosynthesis enzyme MoaA